MTTIRGLVGLTILACVVSAAPARADVVTHWNNIALQAITIGRPGPVGFLDAALVHAGIHDAVQAIEGKFEPYHAEVPAASGSSEAAAAAAAHGILVGFYPSQSAFLDAEYIAYLTLHGLLGNPGVSVGQQVAAQIVPLRRPAPVLPPFVGGTEPGQWRPTPSYIGTPPVPAPFSPMAFLYAATTTPFTLLRPSQFRPEAPPPLTSRKYAREYDEVKALGARFGSSRTPAQTDLAYFWSENFTAQLNRALRGIADTYLSSTSDSARLFALANLAMADAFISCWDSKLHFAYWRPVTAIQEGDDDGNPRTDGDPTWEPLVNTPNYPDYTSGANNVTGAMTRILELFFGTDEKTFTVTSNAPLAIVKSRTYQRFSDASLEVVEARIYLGIHFRSADADARTQGRRVGHWVFQKFLKPVPGAK